MPSTAAFLLLALPWLNPYAPGPSPTVLPLLFSWACAAALLGLSAFWSRDASVCCWQPEAARAWLVAGLLSCLMALCQYLGADASLMPWVNQADIGEAYANLRQRNQFATLTTIALAALLWLAAGGGAGSGARLPPAPSRRRLWLLLAAAALLAAGNAASLSRTGLLQLLLLCLLAWCWPHWRQPVVSRVLLAAVVAYAAATVALPWLAGFDLGTHGMAARLRAGDEACASRLTLWANVLHLVAQRPWGGWGWGGLDYAHYMTLYDGPRFCEILDNAHNLPLHLAVELGVPVAVLVCGGFGAWVIWQKPWRETSPARQLAWGVLAVIGLHSLLEYPLWYGPFQMAFGLSLAWLWVTSAAKVRAVDAAPAVCGALPRSSASRWRSARAFTAVLALAMLAYAAWDYHRISQIYLAPADRDPAYRENTLAKIRSSWLFRDQVQFAELVTTPLSRDNAPWMLATANAVLRYSPEPRVIEKCIESATLLGRDDEALLHLARYRAAFPAEHARWARALTTAQGRAAP